jgi:hypothetical protein
MLQRKIEPRDEVTAMATYTAKTTAGKGREKVDRTAFGRRVDNINLSRKLAQPWVVDQHKRALVVRHCMFDAL